MAIVSSWQQKTPKPSDIQNSSLLEDVFPTKGKIEPKIKTIKLLQINVPKGELVWELLILLTY